MPSKLRKAIGAVKDQTSISLAKVANNNASSIEVAVLKATTHDELPMDERYVCQVLSLISSNKVHAASCARAIGKRIGRTRNWIVALKSLLLVLRTFQDGDPYFPREVLHAMKRGAKILNLSSFRDDSNSSPWDYTAFIRTFALYLDERLDCFLKGKLQRRYTNRESESSRHRAWRAYEPVRDMKPAMLLDKMFYWQRLLDRAIATRPTGPAKTNKLIKISLYAVVQESFDLYKDISDGLALLLDSFFHLQYQSCMSAFQACVRAVKQFEDLCAFYDMCKSAGIGRTSEYPSVQTISEELIETLQEFLKDQSSFPANGRSPSPHLLLPAPTSNDPRASTTDLAESCDLASEPTDRLSDWFSDIGSYCTSVEDIVSLGESGASPSVSCYSEPCEKQSQQDDMNSNVDTSSNHSLPIDQETNISIDLLLFDDFGQEDKQEQGQAQQTLALEATNVQRDLWELVLGESAAETIQASPETAIDNEMDSNNEQRDGWQLVLAETTNEPIQASLDVATNGFEHPIADDFFSETATPQHQYNPFLEDGNDIPAAATQATNEAVIPDLFSVSPTFQSTPTFCAQNPDGTIQFPNEDDPFASCPSLAYNGQMSNVSVDRQSVLHEQQLWLENQNKIIAKHLT